MPGLTAGMDWASTPLGPREGWSPTLKLALEMVLSSGFPMALRWGREEIQHGEALAAALEMQTERGEIAMTRSDVRLRESHQPHGVR